MRRWNSDSADGGAIHAMGNGLMLAYGRGPNLAYLYGPPYSSPSMARITLEASDGVRDDAQRIAGTAIWRHTFTRGDTRDHLALMSDDYSEGPV